MSPPGTPSRQDGGSFPRVSGDEPPEPKKTEKKPAFSPRERG